MWGNQAGGIPFFPALWRLIWTILRNGVPVEESGLALSKQSERHTATKVPKFRMRVAETSL